MKKRKILYLFPLAALILSGCDFSPEGILKSARDFLSDKVVNPVKDFFGPTEKEEPKEEKHDDEKPEEQGGEQGEGEGGEQTPTKTLQEITVSGQFKEEYEVGESFDPTGIVVTAVYDDQSTEDVTAQASFSGFDSENPGELTVTVSYEGKTAEIHLTVLTPIRSLSFAEVEEMFAENGIDGVVVPNYVTPAGESTLDDATGAYLISGSSHEEMEAYAAALEEAGWILEQDSYGDYNGQFGDTLAGLYLADYIDYSYKAIVLQFGMLKAPSTDIPFDDIAAIFEENGYEFYGGVPSFESANATFLADEYSSSGLYADSAIVQITGATEEEFNTYLNTTLPGAGWAVGGGIATKAFQELNGVATLAYGQFEDGSYALLFYFSLSPIPQAGFPSEAIAAAFQELGVTPFEIPGPDGEGYTFEYAFDESNKNYLNYPNYCYDPLYINNMSEEQFNAYITKITNAGWSDSVASSGQHTLTKQFGEKIAKFTLKHTVSEAYGEYAGMVIYYIMTDAPATSWPTAKLNAAFETLGLPAFEITAPQGANLTFDYTYDTSNINYINNQAWCYDDVKVNGMTEEEFTAYCAALVADGWVLDGDEVSASGYNYFDKHFESLKGTASIRVSYASSTSVCSVRVYYVMTPDPAPVWPTDDVAALLGTDVTDVLPPFAGDQNGFTIYDDAYGMGVMINVGEGNEETAMAAYEGTLETALFKAKEGSEHTYISPNNQFIVEVAKGTDGCILLELEIIPQPGFLKKGIEEFLTTRGVTGFTAPDFTSLEEFVYSTSTDDGTGLYYANFQFVLDGDHESAVFAILEQNNFDIGTTLNSWGYECYDPTFNVEMDVLYDNDYDFTIVTVYALVDLL